MPRRRPGKRAVDAGRLLPTGEHRPVDPEVDFPRRQIVFRKRQLMTSFQSASGTGIITTTIEDASTGIRVTQTFPDRFRYCIVYTPLERNAIAMSPTPHSSIPSP